MKIKPTQYPITENDHIRCDMLRVLENEGWYFGKADDFNTRWYNKAIELGVYAVFVVIVMSAICAAIMGLIGLGKALFGG